MSLESDLLIDRRRLKRRLTFWRVAALLAAIVAIVVAAQTRWPTPWQTGGQRVARVVISGLIIDDARLTRTIGQLADDGGIAAVIVAIDSPGGSVGGGEGLHDAIARVAAKKPVVAVMRATAASAGYMVAVPAARIFARAATLTGSIGVLLQTAEISGLLSKIGIDSDAIVSGPLKGQPSLTHPLSPEARSMLQGLVDDMFDQFVSMVAEGRHMDKDAVRKLADGRPYTGRQALALGLVDAIGGEPEARAWLASERNVPADLPVQPVTARTLLERAFDDGLDSLAKTIASQGLTLDGAWALWQPLTE